ncbi:MAG: hypothetical protein SFV81_24495, partial [Pirellulaceae bacterium]|nr:hypothetical protein [Pirellulaceae bacterium]
AKRVAERIISSTDDDKSRVAFVFQRLFLRSATPEESTSSVDFIRDAKQLLRDNTVASEEVELEAWRALVRSLFRLNEFVYLD